MIAEGRTYVVMGLLDAESIAYAIGKTIVQFGGKVIYTVQNERMKKIFFDSSRNTKMTDEEKESLDIRFCDVTVADEVRDLFASTGPIAGVVHSIAFANPKTLLADGFHTDRMDDVTLSYHVSCASLATVVKYAQPVMPDGGGVVALSFDTRHVYPYYNWMGVHKSAMEALVRALARRHGRDNVRINAVSAGPLFTMAASKIPGFGQLSATWSSVSPLTWDATADRQAVADGVAFLLGPYARRITGHILPVDGGAAIVGGDLLESEKPPAPPHEQPHFEAKPRCTRS
ncbi:MAG: SDR family oxidoreductase [Verrucomicrobia bacterium]|nr:SDR family oxidoreductase [Verrucomicrobiota bacterium]